MWQPSNGSDEEVNNSIVDIRRYLGSDGEPLSTGEFQEFWTSLSEEEKAEYKRTPLK